MLPGKFRNGQWENPLQTNPLFGKTRRITVQLDPSNAKARIARRDQKIPGAATDVQKLAAAGSERIRQEIFVPWLQW